MASDNNSECFIELELTDEIKKEQIVLSFRKDKRTNNLWLTLNHVYKQKQIISPVYEGHKWNETVHTFVKKLKRTGVSDKHIALTEDVLNYNYDSVLGLTEPEQEDHAYNRNENHSRPVKIRKYTGNGTLPLHESIVIRDGQTAFLSLDKDGQPRYHPEISRPGMTLIPSDTLDSHNPLPYLFESPDELELYLQRARNESLDSLYSKTKVIYSKYVNIEDHILCILSADTIYSYFQDKFPTLHYNIFVGDNGSGKNSALLLFRHLGYRAFYVVSASAPNYFTFLGEVEECQGTIAEDEAEDIGYDKEKQKILKTGYASGGSVPKVDLTFGRTQGSFLTYCMKWLAMEELPDYKKIKGILDRSFIFRFVVGDVEYNIKDIIKYAGEPKFKPLYDELVDLRKLLFAFRIIHYDEVIPDLCLNIKHRNAELAKPLLRLFSSRNDAPVALEEIRRALSKIISERNQLKRNSIESKLREAINNLILRQNNRDTLDTYAFHNDELWAEVKTVMNGQDCQFKSESFYTIEFGTISHKYIASVYKSKFKAEPFKEGSGSEAKRGWRFSKEVLDRQAIYYDVPDEILILDPADKESATDATDATDYRNGDGQNGLLNEGNKSSDSGQSSINVEPQVETEAVAARIDPIIEHANHENVINNNNSNSINRNDKLDTENSEKKACLSSTCVASVASVAGRRDNIEKDVSPSSRSVASVACVADNDAALAGLPEIPCAWCDYKNKIEFDLGNHILESHRNELLTLPIGRGSIDVRIDYAIQQTKRRMAEQYEDEEDAESNNDE